MIVEHKAFMLRECLALCDTHASSVLVILHGKTALSCQQILWEPAGNMQKQPIVEML